MGRPKLRKGSQFPVSHSRAGPVSRLWGQDSICEPHVSVVLEGVWGTQSCPSPFPSSAPGFREPPLHCDALSLHLCSVLPAAPWGQLSRILPTSGPITPPPFPEQGMPKVTEWTGWSWDLGGSVTLPLTLTPHPLGMWANDSCLCPVSFPPPSPVLITKERRPERERN